MVLTLYNLENSRAIRVHWLACELDVPLVSCNYVRVEGRKADPAMAKDSGYALGKSPCLVDDEAHLTVVESANCMLYLVERFHPDSELIPAPPNFAKRTEVIGWMDFGETILTHALAIVYAQWFTPPDHKAALDAITEKAKANVQKDLDQVESALSRTKYVCGDTFTAADIALAFSCQYVLCKKVGLDGASGWPNVHAWLRRLAERPAYKKAIREGPRYDFTV